MKLNSIYKLLLAVVLFVGVNGSAFAIMQYNISINLTGIEGHGNQVYVGITPNPNECQYAGVYFVNAAELKSVLSVALSAKISASKVRIDYTQPGGAGTQCIGTSIYVQ